MRVYLVGLRGNLGKVGHCHHARGISARRSELWQLLPLQAPPILAASF